MKKQINAVLISLLFLLFIVQQVSASSETFTIPKNGNHSFLVDLNKGDSVKLTATISWISEADDEWIYFGSIAFDINDPQGNLFRNYAIPYSEGVNSKTYGFSAPAKGTYLFNFRDTSFFSNSSKTVTLSYTVTPYEPVAMVTIISVIVIIVIAVIILVAAFWHTIRKRRKAILESYSTGNLPNALSSDAMIAKKTSDIVGIKDNARGSFEDTKQGILLRCNNAWLSNTEFYFKHNYYQISDMTEASVSPNSTLTVKFKTGKIKDFTLAPDDNVHELTRELAFYDKEAAINAFKAYLRAKNQQWADTINRLIREKLELETVTCKYCGAKNKVADVKCFNCGAIL